MKKINVSEENCIGCGACVAIDNAHFEFNEEGKSSVKNNDNLESSELLNAIESCPTSAISIKEVNENECQNANEENECNCNECKDECNDECECEECDCHDEPCENCHCEHKEIFEEEQKEAA